MGFTGAGVTRWSATARSGLFAIRMAEDLMLNDGDLDYCLVVGTEEVDWLLCDAYRRWRLLRSSPPLEVFSETAKGMILSEGAGAVLLARSAPVQIDKTCPASCYRNRTKTKEVAARVLVDLSTGESGFIVASANGTFIDKAEASAIVRSSLPDALVYTLKPALGESIGAAGIWQIIIAALALRHGRTPALLHAPPKNRPVRISGSSHPLSHP